MNTSTEHVEIYTTIFDYVARKEELDPELVEYVEEAKHGWRMLRHPLIVTFYHDNLNAMYNDQLKSMKEHLQEIEAKEDWYGALFFHARPWRMHVFTTKYAHLLPLNVAGDLLTEVWKDSEFPHSAREDWLHLFKLYAPHSQIMQKSKGHLPSEPFEVYRGMGMTERKNRKFGLSWTLDRSIAKWFSTRFGQAGVVCTKKIAPEHVFAYLPERSESEVVLDPRHLVRP